MIVNNFSNLLFKSMLPFFVSPLLKRSHSNHVLTSIPVSILTILEISHFFQYCRRLPMTKDNKG